jgi:hypothetical protein
MKITRMKAGKEIVIPPEKVWNVLCKIIRLSRMVAQTPSDDKYSAGRRAMLAERLDDIEGMTLHPLSEEP